MSVRIITDSASDILREEAEAMDITVLPLKIQFKDVEYLDGYNISHMEFYEKLIESDELPKTSQLTPYDYEQAFDEVSEDEIIVVTMSSQLSGCFQSASMAAMGRDNVYVIDSLNIAVAERILVDVCVRCRDKGMSGKEIFEYVEDKKKRLKLLAVMDTLEYLKKGGRISSTVAIAGDLLSIKPVVTVIDGAVAVLGRARGSKNGNNMLMNLINKEGGIDFSLPYGVAYTGISDALVKKYLKDSEHIYAEHTDNIPVYTVGSAIGTHIGPGTVAVAFFINE